ncbi:MAG: protein NO VEIN domain-containing protein [Anaerolineaceae bacterium]
MDKNIISSGRIITLCSILFIIKEYEKNRISIDEIVKILKGRGLLGGTLPIEDSVRLGQQFGFFITNNNKIEISDYARDYLLPYCDSVEPSLFLLQNVIKHIIFVKKYHWLIFFNEDASLFKAYIPKNWVEVLDTAELFDFELENIIRWWMDIIDSFNYFDETRLKEIGDFGEILTIDYEKKRLENNLFFKKNSSLRWVSRINNYLGYDIRSIRGHFFTNNPNPHDVIYIEVKASVISNLSNFRFILTRNEWDTALNNLNSYYFYCWAAVNINKPESAIGPFIIPAEKIFSLIPSDNNLSCKWTECSVFLDLISNKIN